MTRRAALRALVAKKQGLVIPGAYDGVSARLVQDAGFPAVYMTGYGTAASRLGLPDLGFAGLGEMADHARNLAAVLDVPLIADADTGYGNALNVRRTVQAYEAAGVAALHIEDQIAPKRCGHLAGHQVVPRGEFAGKIRAAVEARTDPDLLVIARTDAISAVGFDEALRRGEAAAEAGADVLFIEAPRTEAHVAEALAPSHAAALQLRAGRPLASFAVRAPARARVRDHPAPGRHPARRGPGDARLPRPGEGARRRPLARGPLHGVRRVHGADGRARPARAGRALPRRRPLGDVSRQRRVPRPQIVLAERPEVRVGEHRVGRPPGLGAVLGGGHRREICRRARQLERAPREVVPARLPRVGEVVGRVGRLREHRPDLAGQVERVARAQHLVRNDTELSPLARHADHRLHEVALAAAEAAGEPEEAAHPEDHRALASLERQALAGQLRLTVDRQRPRRVGLEVGRALGAVEDIVG